MKVTLPVLTKISRYDSGSYRDSEYGYQDLEVMREFANNVISILETNFGKNSRVVFMVSGTSGVVLATAIRLISQNNNWRIQNVDKSDLSRNEDEYTVFLDDHMEEGTTLKRVQRTISPETIDLGIVITSTYINTEKLQVPIIVIRDKVIIE